MHPREVGLRAVGVGAGQACSQTSGGLVSQSAHASSPLCRCPAHTLTRSWPRTEELANDWFEPSVQEARPSPTQVHPCDTHVNGRPAPSVSFAFLLTGRAFFWVGTQVTSAGSTEDHRCPRGCGLTVLVPAVPVPAVVTRGVCSCRQLQGAEMEGHSEMPCPRDVTSKDAVMDRDSFSDGTKGLVRCS